MVVSVEFLWIIYVCLNYFRVVLTNELWRSLSEPSNRKLRECRCMRLILHSSILTFISPLICPVCFLSRDDGGSAAI